MFNLKFFWIAIVSVLLVQGTAHAADRDEQPLRARIAYDIESLTLQFSPAELRLGDQRVQLHEGLSRFYIARNFHPVWFNPQTGNVVSQARSLQNVLRDVADHGLSPTDYHFDPISQLLALVEDYRRYALPLDPFRLAQLDLLLSDAFLSCATHLTAGRVNPNQVHDGQWRARPRQADVVRILSFSLENGRIADALADMVPHYPEYQRLHNVLNRYRLIEAIGGWQSLPSGAVLRPGDTDPRLPLLRKRLWIGGDLPFLSEESGHHFDAVTAQALGRFQARHGLTADRVLGPRTLREINRPVEERVRQIEANLERWRWLPKDLGTRHIRVNIADFRLQVVENERTVMTMPVVVGTAYRKTPVFSGRMTYLEFAPYWGVPETILDEDKLPKIRENINYLQNNNYEIIPWKGPGWARIDPQDINWQQVSSKNFPGLLRMRPGPWNPLGQVKFMFPNEFDVYLHDTPERHQFAQDQRLYSSGCIRIERPLDLAQYLLADDEQWNDCTLLLDLLNGAEPRRIDLDDPLPVHLLYWTAWVDPSGTVQFRPDIYERDAVLTQALTDFSAARRGVDRPAGFAANIAERAGSDQIFEPVKGEEGSGG